MEDPVSALSRLEGFRWQASGSRGEPTEGSVWGPIVAVFWVAAEELNLQVTIIWIHSKWYGV